jgi:uncharacterized protein DUF3617
MLVNNDAWLGRTLLLLVWGAISITATHARADEKPNLKEGLWRMALQMIVPNATGPSTGPTQYERCLAPNNVDKLLAMPAGAPCRVLSSKLTRDALIWEMSCSQQGYDSDINGKINFNGTTLDGKITTVSRGPQPIRITTNIAARYIGKCISTKQPEPASRTGKPLPKFEEK